MAVLALVEPGEELSLQALSLARDLDGPLHALALDDSELGAYGVETVHVAEHEQLSSYAPGAWAACLDQLVERVQPSTVVAAGTNRGNEVLAHLAARRDLPFAANCAAVGSDGTVTRVRWGGSLLEEARVNADLRILSVAPHMVEATTVNGGTANVERFAPELGEEIVRVVEHAETPSAGVSLSEAKV
ncbi:MAG: electron transfer flavoprotein alpha subunit, partial [Thermoleophilaceae bacterium]|nr:electron transfer flavoprotein alpha subunit [Thermoleophilaceae bacterium]